MTLDYDTVKYKNKDYAVMCIKYKGAEFPAVIDKKDVQVIEKLNKTWKCNKNCFVSCSHSHNDKIKDVFLHEIIMALKQNAINQKVEENRPILHLNRIGFDNRRDNLMYDVVGKKENKNMKKKKRTIKLPADSGIKPDEIPTYVWYMKANGSHGPRFMVDIKNQVKWKTTSSKKMSLRYKLEEAKMFLRQLKREKPSLFEDNSMNGDYTKKGKELIKSYYDIIEKAGYDHIKTFVPKSTTIDILKPGKQTKNEKLLLKKQGSLIQVGSSRRRVANNLPKDCGIGPQDLPKHCYYRPEYKSRGSYFIVENHPGQTKKTWQTTSSKKISFQEKYDQLLEYLEEL